MSSLHHPVIWAALGLACLIYIVPIARLTLQPDLRKIPGPLLNVWTGLPLKFAFLRGRRSIYIHSLHQRYGPFVRVAPTEISVSDLAAFKTIHKIGTEFRKSDFYLRFDIDSVPVLFTMQDPKQHGIRRRLFAQAMSNTNVLTFEPSVRSKVETAVSKIERDARQGKADILKWWFFMATDVIGELSFGKSFKTLEQETKTEYVQSLEAANQLSGIRAELPMLVKAFQFMPPFSLANSLRKRLEVYGTTAIQNHRSQLLSNRDTKPTFFSRFLDPKKNQELSEHTIVAEATTFIVAGSDTTAITMTYLCWAVLRPENLHIRKRLLAEVASLPENAAYNDIHTLPYLNAVIQEALRLYSPAPASLPRAVPDGGAQLGGYIIPEKLTVSTQAYTMHRDATIYHHPESFQPERWLEPTPEMKEAFSAFGAGSRVCVGLHLAHLELFLATFVFFKRCADAELHHSTTEDSMAIVEYFLAAPMSHKCEIKL